MRPHHRRGTRGPAPPRTHCAGAGGQPERSLPVGRGPGRRFASFRFSQYPSKQLWLPACPRRSLSRAQPAVGTGALREAACLLGGSCHIGKRGRGQRPCPPKLREHGTARRQAACGPQTPPCPAACAASARRGPGGAGTDTTHVPPGADANAALSFPVAAGSQAQTVTPAPKPFHFPSPREREGSHHGVLLVTDRTTRVFLRVCHADLRGAQGPPEGDRALCSGARAASEVSVSSVGPGPGLSLRAA